MSLKNKVTPDSEKKYSVQQDNVDSSTKDVERGNVSHGIIRKINLGFEDASLEDMYRDYNQLQKRTSLSVLFLFSFMITMSSLALGIATEIVHPKTSSVAHFVLAGTFLAITVGVFLLYRLAARTLRESLAIYLPWILWVILATEIMVIDYAFATWPHSPGGSVGWIIAFVYITFVLLPIRLLWCVILSAAIVVTHSTVGVVLAATAGQGRFSYGHQVGANLLLYLCAAILGALSFLSHDKKQRKAFLETKDSLSIKGTIEEKSIEQERLLLSVLPKHVADEMLEDMAAGGVTGQFRKIYMDRHENVSILFADIVGFTALSSACTAAELVKVLNELFASFDVLSKKYHQLRIKILGDCYYCISGAPTRRADHAVLSVHMGLSVVEAIKMVREKMKSSVNMRVGIHTGAVLGGVIGQKQWQFDVLGKEVNLANKMESGGLPGRVHISEVTASFLNGEFELEPGEGDTREDAIRHAGIKTYLIKSVIKPYPQNTLDEGVVSDQPTNVNGDDEHNSKEEDRAKSAQSEKTLFMSALMEQENSSHMSKMLNIFTLRFKDATLEKQYNSRSVHSYTLSLVGLIAVKLTAFVAQLLILPKNTVSFITFAVGFLLLVVMIALSLLCKFDKMSDTTRFSDRRWFRYIWALLAVTFMAAGDLVDFVVGCYPTPHISTNGSLFFDPNSLSCEYPFYFPYFGALSLIGVTFVLQIGFILKTVSMLVICAVYILGCMLFVEPTFHNYDSTILRWFMSRNYPTAISSAIMLNGLLGSLSWLCGYTERTNRKMFMWRQQAEEQKNKIEVLRESNEKLVLNILPPHIAGHFTGAKKRDNDLLSQAYDEVGVMFAACPNFNDFYTEDAVNNNGLECLRFLNEIISDYDELLNEPRFQSITKIKTVGPTYMAASGMNTADKISPDATIKERWQHLADLTEFALALKDELDKLNSQSFNSFVLRIGINHGPIIGGVIGARKPHYDIWGNTVNVASRMDSTGKAGRIQVVEATMNVLTEFGYKFEKRGLVYVKGKGELMTYFLQQ